MGHEVDDTVYKKELTLREKKRASNINRTQCDNPDSLIMQTYTNSSETSKTSPKPGRPFQLYLLLYYRR